VLGAPRGTGGFGYDPLFFLPELGKTVAELEASTKNALSHRALASREMHRLLGEAWELAPAGVGRATGR
jgi:XTP/dITP diphosphohydrolase